MNSLEKNIVVEKEPDLLTEYDSETKTKSQLQPDDWLCLLCNKKITSDKDRSFYNDRSEFQFTNPGGFIFEIITFSSADGCLEAGEPTPEFSWFPQHSWSYAICSRCNSHLGWKYIGKNSFYGLIKSRLIRGSALFN